MKPSKSLINVSSLLKFEEQFLPVKAEINIESFELGGAKVEVVSPVFFKGLARRLSKGIQVEGHFEVELSLICARCLKKFKLNVSENLKELFTLSENRALLAEGVETYPIEAEKINLTPMIKEQIVLAVPFKALCSEGCRGLCPSCGQDLNLGTCTCQKESVEVKSHPLKRSK